MIKAVYSDPNAQSIIRYSLEENGIKVEIGGGLLIGQDLDYEKIAILKPDEFYNTAYMVNPPKSADGVVIVKNDDEFRLYIVELKSSNLPRISKSHVAEKFSTIFERFFNEDFSHIFVDIDCKVESVDAWLVCDPYGLASKVQNGRLDQRGVDKIRGLMADWQSSFKPYKYREKTTILKVMLTPPVIDCHGHYEAPLVSKKSRALELEGDAVA